MNRLQHIDLCIVSGPDCRSKTGHVTDRGGDPRTIEEFHPGTSIHLSATLTKTVIKIGAFSSSFSLTESY